MRICPAELLSRAEMMICVHRILHRFSMRLLTPPQWEPAFTLRPLNGISVMLSPRC
jgi:cytochrome P450